MPARGSLLNCHVVEAQRTARELAQALHERGFTDTTMVWISALHEPELVGLA
jgi:hypothetical protein